MQKINFQDGTLVKPATVTINNVEHQVTPEQYNGTTPLSAELLNQLQTNIENAIGDISSFEYLIVTELPTENIQSNVLYIVKSGTTGEEKYDAYIYDSEKGWIPVGSSNGKTYLNKETEYIMVVEQDITGETELTIPCNYKVGADSLEVWLCGNRLNKATLEDGSDGYYKEVGTAGSVSNKIKIGNDTYTIKAGEMFTFIVKEHLENIPAIDVLEQLQGSIGTLSSLETTEKTSLVGAINEIKDNEEIQEFSINSYLRNGWANNGFQIFKKGNVKTLNINVRLGTNVQIMVLPEELRPSEQLLFQAINYNLPAVGYIIIATNGTITASSNLVTSNSQNNNCTFNVSYT